MDTVEQLRTIGYQIRLSGDRLHLKYAGSGMPNPGVVRALLGELRERKAEAIEYLQAEIVVDRDEVAACRGAMPASETHAPSPALIAAVEHPAYRPGLPMSEQPEEVEEVWARVTFAQLGRPDPGWEGAD